MDGGSAPGAQWARPSGERRVRVQRGAGRWAGGGVPSSPWSSPTAASSSSSSSIRLHHEPVAELQRKQGLLRQEVRCPLDTGSSQAGGPAAARRRWGRGPARLLGTTDLTPQSLPGGKSSLHKVRARRPQGTRMRPSGLRSGQILDATGLGGSQSARRQPTHNQRCPQPLAASLLGPPIPSRGSPTPRGAGCFVQLCNSWLRRGHGTELHSSKVRGCFLRSSGQGPCQ